MFLFDLPFITRMADTDGSGGGTSNGPELDTPEEDVSGDISELFAGLQGGDESKKEPDAATEEGSVEEEGEAVGETSEESGGEEPGEPEESETTTSTTSIDEAPTPEVSQPASTSPSELDTLRAQVAALTSQLQSLTKEAPKQETEAEAQEPEVLPSVDLKSMFKDVDFDSVMETKEGFLDFLSKALSAVQAQTSEHILSSIPTVVGGFVQRQAVLKDAATQFYTKYPELKRVKRYVAHVANEVSAEHPEWTLMQVLDEAASKAKETLGIQESVESEERRKVMRKPSLPGGTTSTKTKRRPTYKLQSEIDELIKD